MSQPLAKKPAKRRHVKEAMAVEVEPDAWERFEKAVGKIAPPKRPPPKSVAESEIKKPGR